MQDWKSNCCNAEIEVEGTTTMYYICSKCGKPCNATRVFIKGENN